MKKSNELYSAPMAEVIEFQSVSIIMSSVGDVGNGNQPGQPIGEDD